jgi:hypothetical protein
MTLHFTCTLLSKVVLSARAATEGQIDSLDFIPGAKFMGILAKGYDGFDTHEQRDLFHDGTVRFSNAYPYANGMRFYPAPLSYFVKKGDKITDSDVYLDHLLQEKERKKMSEDGDQTKQVRSGFIDAAGEHYLTVETDYQLKSAYDAESRRSKDSQMYGYSSIPKGTVFTFTVESDGEQYTKAITDALMGEHGIGRSRTAEYGRVRIEPMEAPEAVASQGQTGEKTLVYAMSDLCFHDAFGQAKQPDAKDLGFGDGAKIISARTQVQSGLYQSWNTKRWNRNADRWVIKKGTVFYLENVPKGAASGLNWVGSFKQEGFGQVWVNPPFLEAPKGEYPRPKLEQQKSTTDNKPLYTQPALPDTVNAGLLKLLKRRQSQRNNESSTYAQVNKFVKDHGSQFNNISKAQWGTLRSYAKHAGNATALKQLIFSKKTGFLHRGQSEKAWRNSRETLETAVMNKDVKDPITFLQLLAARMAPDAKNQA